MIALTWIVGGLVVLLVLVLGGLALYAAWTARRVEAAVPPLGRFIDVDGAHIHYLDEGSGPPLLLIHGLAGQMRNFTYSLVDKLKRDYRVVVLDRPGSGYSTRQRDAPVTITAQAATIARFARAIGLDRPVVVGHSLGGAIALALALDHPEEVGALALIAPVTHRPEHVPTPFQGLVIASPLLRRLLAWTLAIPMSIANRERTLDALFGPQAMPHDFAKRGGSLLILRPRAIIAASSDLLAPKDDLDAMQARYASLKVPVGIIYGANDRVLDDSSHVAALASKVPGADVELIDGGGHMILINSADACAKFIARTAQRAAASAAKPATLSQSQ
jgi:pimeloyl-ACP methyl ester carboxylesterase